MIVESPAVFRLGALCMVKCECYCLSIFHKVPTVLFVYFPPFYEIASIAWNKEGQRSCGSVNNKRGPGVDRKKIMERTNINGIRNAFYGNLVLRINSRVLYYRLLFFFFYCSILLDRFYFCAPGLHLLLSTSVSGG